MNLVPVDTSRLPAVDGPLWWKLSIDSTPLPEGQILLARQLKVADHLSATFEKHFDELTPDWFSPWAESERFTCDYETVTVPRLRALVAGVIPGHISVHRDADRKYPTLIFYCAMSMTQPVEVDLGSSDIRDRREVARAVRFLTDKIVIAQLPANDYRW